MQILPFELVHLRQLHLQPAQAWMQPFVDAPEYGAQLLRCDSYTAMHNDAPVAIGGLVTVWPGRAHLSALISDQFGHKAAFALLHREVLRRLNASPIARIEATVDDRFEAGHRWMRLLGFQLETPDGMRGYMPDGRTSYLYARIK